jgi:hypothetical protein
VFPAKKPAGHDGGVLGKRLFYLAASPGIANQAAPAGQSHECHCHELLK